MKRFLVIPLLLLLTGCSDKPEVHIASRNICDQSTPTMIEIAKVCAASGGKYPEDCINTAINRVCPEVTGYYTQTSMTYMQSAWQPCSKAQSAEAKKMCAESIQ